MIEEKEISNPYHKPETGLEVNRNILISVPYVPSLSEEFGRICYTNAQVIFKGTNTLKFILMHPKDKTSLHLKQNIVYNWSFPEERCSQSYIGESIKCLENRVKEHSIHITRAIYIQTESNNYSYANFSHFKETEQDSKPVAREAIHMRMNNYAVNHNTGKTYIP